MSTNYDSLPNHLDWTMHEIYHQNIFALLTNRDWLIDKISHQIMILCQISDVDIDVVLFVKFDNFLEKKKTDTTFRNLSYRVAFESELNNVFKMISTCLNDSFEFKWFMPYVSSFESAKKKKRKRRKKKKVAIISFINSWISYNSRTATKNIKKEFFLFPSF